MENRAGWRGQPCPVPAERGGGRGRPGRRGRAVQHPGELRGSGGTPGTPRGTRRDRGRAGLGAAIPAGSSLPGLSPARGIAVRSVLARDSSSTRGVEGKERRGRSTFPLKTAPSPLPWSCSPSLAVPLGFGARSAPPPCPPVCPPMSPRHARPQRGGSAALPSSLPQVRPQRSPRPVPQTNPREGSRTPKGGAQPRPDSFGGPV